MFTCLLIDDDLDDQEVFKLAIKDLDHPVSCESALSAAHAWEKLERMNDLPSIIFLDLNMPGMHGKDFLEQIKSISRFSNIPVVIYSTLVNRNMERELKILGAVDYIDKPSSVEKITETLQTIFKNYFSG